MRPPLRIILADDDKDDCFLFSEAVEELAIPIDLAIVYDGSQLMQYLNDMSSNLPDGLFLDLNMPRKNGDECLNEIKNHAEFQHLPIIIFSTSFNNQITNRLFEKGANYYMRKPSDFSILKQLIERAISHISSPPVSQPTLENFILTHY